MMPIDRFQDELPGTLIDLADERMPIYMDNLLGRTAAMRQRPALAFPGRWIPMADLVAERSFVPRLPWRALGVAALLALLIAGVVLFAGSQRRVPPPFGPAANGVIAYSRGGDIYTADSVAGVPTLIVTGPDRDTDPLFSPDGGRVAFLRESAKASGSFDLMVAGADGSRVVNVSTTPLANGDPFQWAPDGRGIVVANAAGQVLRLDASGAAQPVVLASNVDVEKGAFRPPAGAQILFQRRDVAGLNVMNADGSGPTMLVPESQGEFGYQFNHPRWSPDGAWIAFVRQTPSTPVGQRIFVVRANGRDLHQLTTDGTILVENDEAWSPDSARVAFNRWQHDPTTDAWVIKPIGVVSIPTGAFSEAGSPPVSDGSLFDWSPDGGSLLGLPGAHATYGSTTTDRPVVINVADGQSHELDWLVESAASWQRTAP